MQCRACDQQRVAGNKFCSECGTRLADSALISRNERRQITVLFYDLVGSTQLAAACEPEDFRETITRFHQLASEAVAEYDAFIGAHVGDGGILYFGYPLGLEDAAECAILAGLALAAAVGGLTLPDGRTAQVRIGIATGTVVVGPIAGGDTGNSAVGQVTSQAARLQANAEPGEVIIADRTRRLVGRLFELESLGFIEAKGFAEGLRAWKVSGRSSVNRFAALRSDETELIGRERETGQLEEQWRAAVSGGGRMCLIAGEAGMGKSRLAVNFTRQLKREGALRVNCFCAPHSRQAALRPFADLMRRVAGGRDGQAAPSLELLDQWLHPDTPPLDRSMLAQLGGLHSDTLPGSDTLTANQQRAATIAALIRQLSLMSRDRPVVMLIEDIHWADPSSLELLERILDGEDAGTTLIVLTGRPEALSRWSAASRIAHVELEPFDTEESCQFINRILGGTASSEMLLAITERAGGVALFIEELTKSILEADAFVQVAGADSYELTSGFALPETLQDSLLARLDQMGDAKRVAQVAAVVGREFSAETVERLAPELSPFVAASCNKLYELNLIMPFGGEPGMFQFRHVLIQEIAYSTLVRDERKDFNDRLLTLLEQGGPNVRTDYERWAHYAYEAWRADRSVHYWLLAGLESLGQFAMSEADARLRRGLDLLPKVQNEEERQRLELDLRLTLGKVLLACKGHANPETGEMFNRAGALAEKIGDPRKMLAALHGQQAHDLQLSRMREARSRSSQILALAEQAGDDVWKLVGLRSRGISSFPLGDYAQSVSDLSAGLELCPRVDPALIRQIVADDLDTAMLIYCSWSLIFLGRYDEGRAMCRAACERAERIGQPYTRAFSLIGKAYCKLLMGDLDGIEDDFAQTLAVCEEHEIWYFLYTTKVHHAHARALMGDRRALAALHDGIEGYRKTGSILYQPTYVHWHALALLAAGKDAQARETNDWTIRTAEAYDMHHMLGEYYGLRAVLHQRAGQSEEAQRAAGMALSVAARQKAVLSERLNADLWAKYGVELVATV